MADKSGEKKESSWNWLLWVVATILFFYVVDWGFLSGRITDYPVMCPSDYNGCYTLGTNDYYPSAKNQTVKSKTEFEITTYKKCTVINRKNWECHFDDESGIFGFNNGEYHDYSISGPKFLDKDAMEQWEKETHYVGRLKYLLFKWNIINSL